MKNKISHYNNIRACTNCGNIYKDLSLANRTYICPICGNTEDRDVHAAKNMIWL